MALVRFCKNVFLSVISPLIIRRLTHAFAITLQILDGKQTDCKNDGGENLNSRQTAKYTKLNTFFSGSRGPTATLKQKRNTIKKDFLSTAPGKKSLQGIFQKE